jgi:peptidoglycan L-alanyl-D-glutamate endopeptidase CwlK
MPSFGKSSRARLDTCDPRIVEIFEEVIKHIDCSILEGRRDKDTQNELFRQGKSKLQWPDSKHNVVDPSDLSKAIDCVPYPIDWNDWNRFYHFCGLVQAVALMKGYKLRSGLDWDQDYDFSDQSFNDAPHFELVD